MFEFLWLFFYEYMLNQKIILVFSILLLRMFKFTKCLICNVYLTKNYEKLNYHKKTLFTQK